MKRIVFNASLPRSGSELLQVILDQNPSIYGSTTSPLLEYQFAARGNMVLDEVKSQDPNLMAKAFLSMCGSMAQGYYAPITDKPIVCDKNRGWSHYYEWVDQWNPDPKIICMVRDPRAIIWSLEKKYRENRYMPGGPDDPANMRGMTFTQRSDYWLTSQPLGLALLRFEDSIQRGISDRIHYVKYEDLLADPQVTMNAVHDYCDIEQYQYDFDNIHKTSKEDYSVFGPFGDHAVQPRLDATKLDGWKANVPVEVSDLVASRAKLLMNRFDY